MTLAFLMEYSSEDDVLFPVTPVRLAFLTRNVLLDVSPAMVSDSEVYSEIWNRRVELAVGIEEDMREYKSGYFRSQNEVDSREVLTIIAAALFYISLGFLAAGLAEGLEKWMANSHTGIMNLVRPQWVTWLVFVILFIASMGVGKIGNRTFAAKVSGDWRQIPRIKDHLTAAVAAMVNEIANRETELTSGVMLQRMPTPRLIEFGSAAIVLSQSFKDVLSLVDAHVTSAVGVAGTRGAGKSTLLRLLCNADDIDPDAPARIGVYLAAPSSSAESEFIKIIYGTTVKQVLNTSSEFPDRRARWRRALRIRPDTDIALAQQTLERITGSISRSRQSGLGVSRLGLSVNVGRQRIWTEREHTHADWVADFRDYLERHRLLNGDPIIIAIDELDKVSDPEQAIEVINSLKDLFHIQGTHFIVSVSDDALRSFATRGVPVRDAFDSSFDSVVEVPNLTSRESFNVLQARARFFPGAIALFCHAWSAGVPRDLIRVARSCATIPHWLNRSVPITEITQQIIRHDIIEFMDAMIRSGKGQTEEDTVRLLEIKRIVSSTGAMPLHSQIANSGEYQNFEVAGNRILSSLQQFLDTAGLVSEYFFSPRDSRKWAEGIGSGRFHEDADLLAQAKAALAIHPAEAAWRIQHARNLLGISSARRNTDP